jgi:type IV pilus assembly protein PilV
MRKLHTPTSRPCPTQGSRGVALIEVLVAMLVFAFGVLALVGLQGSLLRAQTESKARADAAYLASEVLGKLWADPTRYKTYGGNNCANVDACKEWQTKVGTALPGGQGTLEVVGSAVNVTVSWTAPGGNAHQYVTHTTVSDANGN